MIILTHLQSPSPQIALDPSKSPNPSPPTTRATRSFPRLHCFNPTSQMFIIYRPPYLAPVPRVSCATTTGIARNRPIHPRLAGMGIFGFRFVPPPFFSSVLFALLNISYPFHPFSELTARKFSQASHSHSIIPSVISMLPIFWDGVLRFMVCFSLVFLSFPIGKDYTNPTVNFQPQIRSGSATSS